MSSVEVLGFTECLFVEQIDLLHAIAYLGNLLAVYFILGQWVVWLLGLLRVWHFNTMIDLFLVEILLRMCRDREHDFER